MKDYDDNRRPEEIEHDIERTRAQLSSNIDAIQSKLTPGQMMDQAIGYARTSLPADFGSNLNHAVRENPIPVTLIGLGLAWLAMSGKQRPGYMNASSHRSGRGSLHHDSTHRPGSGFASEHGIDYAGQGDVNDHGVGGHITGDHDDSGMHKAGSRMSEKGQQLKGRASETGRNLKEKASSATQSLKEKVGAAGQSIRGRASEMSQRFSESKSSKGDRSSGMTQNARARASELGQRSQQQYYRAKSNLTHMVEEQPLLLGALGVAVGTLIGAMLPPTRREDELLGRTRDDLFERGQQMARERAEQLKSSAQRVAEAAQEEAKRAGSEMLGQQANGQSRQRDGAGTADEASRGSQSLH